MHRWIGALVVALLLLWHPAWAQQARFQVGQRVVQQTTGATGTITAINVEQHQVMVHFDGQPAGTSSPFFWGTPDLQPSNKPASAPPPNAGGPGNTPGNTPPAVRRQPMSPVGGALTEAIVRGLIEDGIRFQAEDATHTVTFNWKKVSIAGARRIDAFTADREGLPPGTSSIVPVQFAFDYTVRSTKFAADTRSVQRVGSANFYLDPSNHWNYTFTADGGTVTR